MKNIGLHAPSGRLEDNRLTEMIIDYERLNPSLASRQLVLLRQGIETQGFTKKCCFTISELRPARIVQPGPMPLSVPVQL